MLKTVAEIICLIAIAGVWRWALAASTRANRTISTHLRARGRETDALALESFVRRPWGLILDTQGYLRQRRLVTPLINEAVRNEGAVNTAQAEVMRRWTLAQRLTLVFLVLAFAVVQLAR